MIILFARPTMIKYLSKFPYYTVKYLVLTNLANISIAISMKTRHYLKKCVQMKILKLDMVLNFTGADTKCMRASSTLTLFFCFLM